MNAIEKTRIMDDTEIDQVLTRMSAEIMEQLPRPILLVGIHSRGVPLAQRIFEKMNALGCKRVEFATINISFYKDDLTLLADKPIFKGFDSPRSDLKDVDVVFVDDVLYSGQTILTAINEIMKYSIPGRIRLAVLIDRGHRCFPIRADYVGKLVPTRKTEMIKVMLKETDGEDRVIIMELEQ